MRLALHQLKYEQKAFWRNPPAAVFTFAFPVMFLVIFASLNAGNRIGFLDGLPYNQYFVPAIAGFGLISACFTNLAMTLALRRDSGVLKRLRATPLPASALLAGLLLNALVVSLVLLVLLLGAGALFYGVEVPAQWPAIALAVLIGVACFSALGVAMSALVPNADAAPAVVNGILLPVAFISGVFFRCHPMACCRGSRGSSRCGISPSPCSRPSTRGHPTARQVGSTGPRSAFSRRGRLWGPSWPYAGSGGRRRAVDRLPC